VLLTDFFKLRLAGGLGQAGFADKLTKSKLALLTAHHLSVNWRFWSGSDFSRMPTVASLIPWFSRVTPFLEIISKAYPHGACIEDW